MYINRITLGIASISLTLTSSAFAVNLHEVAEATSKVQVEKQDPVVYASIKKMVEEIKKANPDAKPNEREILQGILDKNLEMKARSNKWKTGYVLPEALGLQSDSVSVPSQYAETHYVHYFNPKKVDTKRATIVFQGGPPVDEIRGEKNGPAAVLAHISESGQAFTISYLGSKQPGSSKPGIDELTAGEKFQVDELGRNTYEMLLDIHTKGIQVFDFFVHSYGMVAVVAMLRHLEAKHITPPFKVATFAAAEGLYNMKSFLTHWETLATEMSHSDNPDVKKQGESELEYRKEEIPTFKYTPKDLDAISPDADVFLKLLEEKLSVKPDQIILAIATFPNVLSSYLRPQLDELRSASGGKVVLVKFEDGLSVGHGMGMHSVLNQFAAAARAGLSQLLFQVTAFAESVKVQ